MAVRAKSVVVFGLSRRERNRARCQKELEAFLKTCGLKDVHSRRQASSSWPEADGLYPIHLAAIQGNYKVMRALLASNVDSESRSPDGRTALDYAEKLNQNGSHEDVLFLLRGKVKVLSLQAAVKHMQQDTEFDAMAHTLFFPETERTITVTITGFDPSASLQVGFSKKPVKPVKPVGPVGPARGARGAREARQARGARGARAGSMNAFCFLVFFYELLCVTVGPGHKFRAPVSPWARGPGRKFRESVGAREPTGPWAREPVGPWAREPVGPWARGWARGPVDGPVVGPVRGPAGPRARGGPVEH
ncbi:unnamed protein product [Cladocopium goreaui]|uniref:Pyrimidine-specific ribonucleoside hydrolase RihB n=1 Tax=Cladocopium goreaui TaxID=2562237 RepID=A0A9P1BQA0_9DINO|nr:unnamed protein product [Cladocopium goreaui]